MPLSLENHPFSSCGSWMSLRLLDEDEAPANKPGLYLCSARGGLHPVCRIRAFRDTAEIEFETKVATDFLRLESVAGFAEITFEESDQLRIRAQMITLVFDFPGIDADGTQTSERTLQLGLAEATRKYHFELIHGELGFVGGWRASERKEPAVRLSPTDDDGNAEIAIDAFGSSWIPSNRPRFDTCRQEQKADFQSFAESLPNCGEDYTEAREVAAYLLWSQTVEAEGVLSRPAILKSTTRSYLDPWSCCFNAIALAAGQPAMALAQLEALIYQQDEMGAYPHQVGDQRCSYGYAQPPIHAWAVNEVFRRLPASPRKDTRLAIYDSLCRQMRWWLDYRIHEDAELPHYLHGSDSGCVDSSLFDEGVPLIAPDLASFLIRQADELAVLADGLGHARAKERWNQLADRLQEHLIESLWRTDTFIARRSPEGTEVRSKSLQQLLPLFLGDRLPPDIRDACLEKLRWHITDFGAATELTDSTAYSVNSHWRGPIQPIATYFLTRGLEKIEEGGLKATLNRQFCELCSEHGFSECFDARTGVGLQDSACTATASIFLLLAEELV